MHDIRVLREQMDVLRDALKRRGALDGLVTVLERAERLERDRRTIIQAVEERKAARNATSQDVAQRKRKGEDASDAITRGRELGEEITRLEGELGATEEELRRILLEIPNITLPATPAGGEENNRI